MLSNVQFLLEPTLLLDTTHSSGVTQVVIKFRNKKFRGKV